MSCRFFLVLILCVISIKLKSQTEYPTENKRDIYWQHCTKINFSDYQSQNDEKCLKYKEKYGTNTVASIGFRAIVDIPKKWGKNSDKLYLAPVFCKNCSCILSEDSLSLLVDRLMFDVAEIFARKIRKELLELQDTMKINNTYSMFFTTIHNKFEEEMLDYCGTVLIDVLIEKKDSAYIEWRKTVDNFLQQTEDYATRPEDCYRLVLGKPIEKGYKMAKTIMGDMRKK
ncbi:MAG: hypothetical protein LBV69_05995 [Bacteroidales bacterium]|jgi:hypothetical protein|nr:hypothetical protein [Bacteroidales bacterium]